MPTAPERHPPNIVAVARTKGYRGAHQGEVEPWLICNHDHDKPNVAIQCAVEALSEMGRRSYASYSHTMGGVTWDMRPMPTWDELPEHIRDGWRMAALSGWIGSVIE